jgi:hypothetical protein
MTAGMLELVVLPLQLVVVPVSVESLPLNSVEEERIQTSSLHLDTLIAEESRCHSNFRRILKSPKSSNPMID